MALWDKLISGKDSGHKRAKELWDRSIKYYEGKLYNRALKDLQEAIELNPDYLKEAVELMQVFSAQGNDEQAVSVGYALLKTDSTNVELMNKLGNSLRNLNSFDKAKRLYTHALKVNPKFVDARYNLAASSFRITAADSQLIRQTKTAEAFKLPRRYEFQADRVGFHPVPNESLEQDESKPAEEEGEEEQQELSEEDLAMMRDGMIKELKSDLEANPDSWAHEFNMALLYDLFDFGELAIQRYKKAVALEPENRMSANNLGVALMVHKKALEEAGAVLLENLSEHRYDRTTVLNLGMVYRETGKAFQTLKYFVYLGDLLEKSLGEFETDKVEQHANELYGRRKYLEAIPIFENLATETGDSYWLEKLAVMYFNQKKEEQYIGTLQRLLKADPDHADAANKLTGLADSYEEQAREKAQKGSRYQAIQLFEKAVKIEETAERWVELAQLYEEEGEEILMDNALKRWKQLTSGEAEEEEEAADAEKAQEGELPA